MCTARAHVRAPFKLEALQEEINLKIVPVKQPHPLTHTLATKVYVVATVFGASRAVTDTHAHTPTRAHTHILTALHTCLCERSSSQLGADLIECARRTAVRVNFCEMME